MVEAVAENMEYRFGDAVEYALVHLGLGTLRNNLDLLAKICGEVTYVTPEAAEQRADRHHTDIEYALAQSGDQAANLLGCRDQSHLGRVRGQRSKRTVCGHQLSDHVDQLIEAMGGNSHGLVARMVLRATLATAAITEAPPNGPRW